MEEPARSSRWRPTHRRRPSRADVEPAALELIARYGASIMSTARRYSASPEDAEDAYQRGLEILLTKAPSTDEHDLVPWLKTVVKHEAFALRRQGDRASPTGEELIERCAEPATPAEEHLERYDRLRVGAEAMQRLKPQEVRCLLLRAEGYSYHQICQETGWSYTKVNRCLTEGRRSFFARVASIESGAECQRMAPLLSALADGEATPKDMTVLRPHLRSCLSCRATLRDYRTVPARVAALVPPSALIGAGDGIQRLGRGWESLAAWMHERGGELAARFHASAEMASAQKVAAVAASTVALAGGGVVTVRTLEETAGGERGAQLAGAREPGTGPKRPVRSRPRNVEALPATGPSEADGTRSPAGSSAERRDRRRPDRASTRRPGRSSPPPPGEFEPAPASSAPAPTSAPASPSSAPAPASAPAAAPAPAPASSAPSSNPDGGEFAP